MSEKLKPCPFCGSENVRFEGEKHAVVCMRCKARGCIAPTEDASLDMWNDRAGNDHVELTSVNIGEVATFPNALPGKEQALKVLEEAAEVFGAWQAGYDHVTLTLRGGRFWTSAPTSSRPRATS